MDPVPRAEGPAWGGLEQIPRPLHARFDFVSNPMNPTLAMVMYCFDVYFVLLLTGRSGWRLRAHKKHAHKTYWAAAIHGMGSCVELTVGLFAVIRPESVVLAKITTYIALFINLPTGFMMTPRVFGVKHLTVPGFALQGVLRLVESYRVLMLDHRLVPNLWILLHVGTVVRLLGYYVLPYSSKDGVRGDLFTGASHTCRALAWRLLVGLSLLRSAWWHQRVAAPRFRRNHHIGGQLFLLDLLFDLLLDFHPAR